MLGHEEANKIDQAYVDLNDIVVNNQKKLKSMSSLKKIWILQWPSMISWIKNLKKTEAEIFTLKSRLSEL